MIGRPWRWAGLATGLLIVAVPAVQGDEPTQRNLNWVPQNAAAFVHVRFAELWNSPVGRDVAKIVQSFDPKALAEVEAQLGIPLARLDTITFLLPDLVAAGREPGFVVRLTTTKPYKRRDVLDAIKAKPLSGAADAEPPPNNFYRSHDGMMIHLTDDRSITLISSQEGAVAFLGRLLSPKKTGALTDALRLAAGKDHLVAAYDLAQPPFTPMVQLPPNLKALRPLLEGKRLTLTGNIGANSSQIQLDLVFANNDDATEARPALEAGRKMIQQEMVEQITRMEGAAKQFGSGGFDLRLGAYRELLAALSGAKIEQRDATLRVTASLRTGAFVSKVLTDGAAEIRNSADRSRSQNNLKQIGIAMHNFHDVNGALPPAAICDKNGKPLLSWRVAILPYIEQDNLYKQFHLDEPWDSDHNKKLLNVPIATYVLPGNKGKRDWPGTYYQTLVGNDAMFDLRKGTRFAQITDGLSNTLMVVEAAEAAPWSKPDDIAYDPAKVPNLGYHFGNACNVLMGDGSVRGLNKALDPKLLHLLIQRSDGQPIPNIP